MPRRPGLTYQIGWPLFVGFCAAAVFVWPLGDAWRWVVDQFAGKAVQREGWAACRFSP